MKLFLEVKKSYNLVKFSNRKKIEKINETKNCFFGMINKLDKLLVRLTENKTDRMTNIRNEIVIITIDSLDIKKVIIKYMKLSFRNEGAIKTFSDKEKLREVITTRPTLQETQKEVLQVEMTCICVCVCTHSREKNLLEIISKFSKVAG